MKREKFGLSSTIKDKSNKFPFLRSFSFSKFSFWSTTHTPPICWVGFPTDFSAENSSLWGWTHAYSTLALGSSQGTVRRVISLLRYRLKTVKWMDESKTEEEGATYGGKFKNKLYDNNGGFCSYLISLSLLEKVLSQSLFRVSGKPNACRRRST